MADGFEIGKALVIPKDVLSNLQEVDEKINKIATDSENMATKFTAAMSNMSAGTGDLIQKLQTIQGLVGSIGNINIKGLDNASTSMSKTSIEAEKVANNVTQAATAINKMGNADVSSTLSKMTSELSKLNDDIKLYYGYIGTGKKTYIEFGQQELKTATTRAEELMRAISALDEAQKRLNQSGSIFSDYIDDLNGASLSAQRQADEMKKLNQYYKELEQTSAKKAKEEEKAAEKAVKAAEKEAKAVAAAEEKKRKELQKTYDAQAKLDSQLRKSNYQSYITSTEGSLRTADKANTYAQRAQAIKNLEEAIKKLRKTDANYQKDLQRLSDAHKRLSNEQKKVEANYKSIQSSQRRLMDTSGQLARQLALIFSVSQIEGYISKLVKVRGEFELQNTALASILQNKDQADKLFGQITELAIKSPFTVKELTTYTKSLAAYSVEYEKLYDTTKMLADVSAGLGVDMQRLILAFGQVKAANFLRGTETRQFTEAGINLLGELAKYYSELEDRIVSIGEVQERQFKRMISFADVEEVFKRLTSSSGMFYEMQEKQSETLWGMMSNLQDSIDIMLNSIGESNEGILKGVVNILKTIVDNWEILANIIKSSAVGFAFYAASVTKAAIANKAFAASNIEATITAGGLNKATAKIITSMKSLANWAKANPFILIASAATLATLSIVDHYKKVQKAKEEYDIFTRSIDSTKKEISNIKKSVDENNRIIEENSQKVSSLSSNTDEYQEAQEKLNKAQKNQSYLLEDLKNKFPEIYNGLVKQKDGTIDMTEAQKAYNDELERTRTLNFIMQEQESFFGDGIFEDLKELEEAQIDYNKNNEKIQNVYNATILKLEKLSATSESFAKRYKYSIEEIKGSNESYEKKLKQLKDLAPATIFNEGYFAFSDISTALYNFSDAYTIYTDKAEDANKRLDSLIDNALAMVGVYSVDAFKGLEDSSKQSAKRMIENFVNTIPNIKNEFIQKFVNERLDLKLGFTIEFNKETPKELSDWQKRINDYIKDNNLEISPILSTDTTDSYFSNLRNQLKQSKEEAEKLKQATELRGETGESNKAQLAAEEQRIKNITTLLKAFGEYDKEKTNSDNKELKRLKEQISLIKKAGEQYEKLIKYYSKDEATAKVREAFGAAFSNLGLDITMDFDTTGIIKGIENISHAAGKEGKKAVDEAVAPLKSQQDIDVRVKGLNEIQKQLDDVFSGYELSVELEKMGLDNNLIGQLFNVDTFSLEDVQKNLDKLKPQLMSYGDEGVKVFSDMEKKITEMQKSELQERLKTYASYLKKTVTERVAIELEAQKEIAKVQATQELTQQQKEQVTSKIKEEANKKKDEQAWKDFQGTDMYIRMFEDLESASTKSLDLMEQKLLQLRESLKNLSPSDLKEINNQLEKIQELKIQRNPFQGLVSNIKELIKYQKQAKSLNEQYAASIEKEEYLTKSVEMQQLSIDSLQKRYSEEVKINGEGSQQAINAKSILKTQQDELDVTLKLLEAQGKITKELADQIRNGEKTKQNVEMSFGSVGNYLTQLGSTVTSVASSLENVFGTMDDKTADIVSSFADIVNGLGEMSSGVQQILSGDVIGGAMSVISGLASTIGSIFNIGDKKKEREIQRQLELVEDLQYAYEKLEKAIDDAYSIDTYKKASEQAIANLEAQNAALEQAISAEEAKKKTDDDRIKEWQQQMEDNNEAIAELLEEQFSQVTGGILDDLISAASDFTDAWLESFREIGDGMDGLEDSFQEMLETMLKQQASMLITSSFLDNWKKELEQYINADDLELTADEAKKWVESVESSLPALNEALENYYNAMKEAGFDLLDEDDTMSALSSGISSISEETAQALEALLNSVRFYTSDSNTVLHNIYNAIAMPTAENPFLAEMKVQSTYLSSISSLLSSVSKNVQSNGRAIKVQIV